MALFVGIRSKSNGQNSITDNNEDNRFGMLGFRNLNNTFNSDERGDPMAIPTSWMSTSENDVEDLINTVKPTVDARSKLPRSDLADISRPQPVSASRSINAPSRFSLSLWTAVMLQSPRKNNGCPTLTYAVAGARTTIPDFKKLDPEHKLGKYKFIQLSFFLQ